MSHHTVNASLHYFVKYEWNTYITIITNKHFCKWKEKTLYINIKWMICTTLDCVRPTQSRVIRIIHRNVGLLFFFHLHVFKCLLLSLFFHNYISQNSVEKHLRCGEICNNHITANCPQSVPVKKIWKSLNKWRRCGQKYSCTFLWTTVYNLLCRKFATIFAPITFLTYDAADRFPSWIKPTCL